MGTQTDNCGSSRLACGLICNGADGTAGGTLAEADGQGGGLLFGNGGNGATDAAGEGGDRRGRSAAWRQRR